MEEYGVLSEMDFERSFFYNMKNRHIFCCVSYRCYLR
jgi:hypothetical protein